MFATYPAFDGLLGNLFSEFLGTAVLLFGVRAVTDRRNASPGANLEPVLIGCIVWAIGLSLGGLTGYAINPARDFGPRLASAVLGWGTSVFRSHGATSGSRSSRRSPAGRAGRCSTTWRSIATCRPPTSRARPAASRPERRSFRLFWNGSRT